MKYSGRTFILQISDDGETWVSCLSDRSTSFTVGGEQVDITDKGDAPWRVLGNHGVRSSSISCSGVVTDRASFATLVSATLNGSIIYARVIHGDAAEVIASGRFLLSLMERTGEHNNAEAYSLTLESANTTGGAEPAPAGPQIIAVSAASYNLVEGVTPVMVLSYDDGTLGAVTTDGAQVSANGPAAVVWHRVLQCWYAITPWNAPSGKVGIWKTSGSSIGSAFPTGWALVHSIGAHEVMFLFSHSGTQMPDGGVAFITSPDGTTRYFTRIDASGAVSTDVVIPNNSAAIFCPRGGTRVFVVAFAGVVNNPLHYADAPYTTWSTATGTDTTNHNWFSWIGRSSDDELIAVRPWVRYGPGSGSQDEIWQSHDNGASWTLKSRPWGVYGSMTADCRDGAWPTFWEGRWYWASYGDAISPVFVSTADFNTFETSSFPGANRCVVPGGLLPLSASNEFLVPGSNPPAGGSTDNGYVKVIRTPGVGISYDDSFNQWPVVGSDTVAGSNFVGVRDDRAWSYEL